jgi:hypothetical protein
MLRGEISDAEWDVLMRFLDRFDRLAATRMGAGCEVSWKLTLGSEGARASGTLPPNDDVDAFLYRMRPFVLNDESTNFFKVCKVISRRVVHPGVIAWVREQRNAFAGHEFQRQITIRTGAGVLNSDETLRLWLNGSGEYHSDSEREASLKRFSAFQPAELRPLFVSMMIDKAKAVAEVARLVMLLAERGTRGKEIAFGGLTVDAGSDSVEVLEDTASGGGK